MSLNGYNRLFYLVTMYQLYDRYTIGHSAQLPIIDCHLLLWGDETHYDDTNQHIPSVQKFIRDSGRFTNI